MAVTSPQMLAAAQQSAAQTRARNAGGGGQLPFRRGTDLRISPLVDSRTWTASTRLTPVRMPDVGFWDYVIIQLTGTMNLGGTGSLATKGPWNIMNRLQVNLNIGGGAIDDLSGWGAYITQHVLERSWKPDASVLSGIYAAPVGTGNNSWTLTWFLPVAANPYINMDLGPINLQSDKLRATVDLICGANTDAVSSLVGGTGLGSGTLNVYYGYWEVPDPNLVEFPPLYVHRILEEAPAIAATGDTVYKVPRQGSLLQMAHTVVINGARDSADVTQARLVYDKTTTPVTYAALWINNLEFIKTLGKDAPTGVVLYDRWHAQGLESNGDFRDVIETLPIAELDSIVTIASTATLGTNNNLLETVRRFAEPLVQ